MVVVVEWTSQTFLALVQWVHMEVEVEVEVVLDLMLPRRMLHKPHFAKKWVRGLVNIPYELSVQQVMWVVKVGEEGEGEESYPSEPFSSHLMMEGKAEVEVMVVVVTRI